MDMSFVSLVVALGVHLIAVVWFLAGMRSDIRSLREKMDGLATKLELETKMAALRTHIDRNNARIEVLEKKVH